MRVVRARSTAMHQCRLFRGLIIHQNEPARQRARGVIAFAKSSPKHSGKERRWRPCLLRLKNRIEIAALAFTDTQVRARAVLPGSCRREPQATLFAPRSAGFLDLLACPSNRNKGLATAAPT